MKHQNLEIKYKPVADLIPYVNNARTHSDDQVTQIAASIKEFGFTNPILLDGDNGVIAGHGRLMAAKKLGMDTVPCIELSGLSETQKKAYILADNRLAEKSGWDEDIVKVEFEALKADGFDIDSVGLDFEELFPDINSDDGVDTTDEPDTPEPPVVPKTRPGDIWTMGGHRLMCGDSTSIDAIYTLCECDGESPAVDLLLTDPPYNVAYQGKTADALTIENDHMDDGSFQQFLVDALSAANAVMKPGAAFYIWHAGLEGFNFLGACRDVEWQVRECLIWVKNSLALGRQDYQWRHEPCLYGWKDGAGHKWYSDRSQTTVLEFDKPRRNGDHPTMKPVELFAYQIKNSTKKGDIVLDSFGGSGTTMLACEQLGRRSRLMELDPKYCDVIIRRWQELSGKDAVRDDGVKFNDLGGGDE